MAFCVASKMRLLNMVTRTIRCSSAFHTLVQEGRVSCSSLRVPCQQSLYRTISLFQCLRAEDTKLDLDEWKTIMKSDTQSTETELNSETQEDPSLASMRELVEMWRLAGRAVPTSMTTEQVQALVELSSVSSRKKYLKFLSIKETEKKNRIKKKQELQKAKMETLTEPAVASTEVKNTLFLKFWDSSIDNLLRWRVAQAMTLGQPLVFDMVYENYMSRYELENTVYQLMLSEGWNRRAKDPFHLYFCSLQPNGPYHKELVKRYTGAWDNVLVTATEKSHVDIFPQDQLVYLTADSPNELKRFDHNKVYIVGSIVDRCQQTGLSLANAKRLNLTTARLPLDRYLKWDSGAKNLTLDQMTCILLSLKEESDWKKALSFVPTRKHEGFIERGHSREKSKVKKYKYAQKW
ncbi:tRNA methyltransferase 10 homolog C isoform X2 [Spea bombifrons]|nr:tRNA methyltransferase 10 homolog C isoform X2 [Spea bombifrons]XP_053313386.1 tRNA methyltransferase 10 homolog C isoform X2 [Spea bombifrons]